MHAVKVTNGFILIICTCSC